MPINTSNFFTNCHHPLPKLSAMDVAVAPKSSVPNENQDFVEEKFKELDSDQIEGGEFEF